MKKYINIVTLSIALVFAFSISTFAKNDVNQANKALNVTEKLVTQVTANNPMMAKQFSSRLNQLKAKCNEGDSMNECAAAIAALLKDLVFRADCITIIADAWAVIEKCFAFFAQHPNKSKTVLNNAQANLRNTDKNLGKYDSKIKFGQSLVVSSATS
jgi:hypothetical protein